MQTTESKTTTPSLQLKTAQSPFFQQEWNGDFMGRSNASLFSAGGTQQPFFTKPTLQTKLTIGQPGDQYEQEADQMADQVVQRLAGNNTNPKSNIIQPKCATCQEEEKLQQKEEPEKEEKLQKKPIFESNAEPPELPIQTKLEKTSSLQKKCDECTTEEETPGLQRAADSTVTPSASPSLESRLSSSRGGGNPLPENTRTQMEGAFGTDFSGVRVHTDSSAVQMNQELNALAFTHGSDVYFNAGKYDAGSTEGQRLLGHELTHVVQQGEGVRRQMSSSSSQQVTPLSLTNLQLRNELRQLSQDSNQSSQEIEDRLIALRAEAQRRALLGHKWILRYDSNLSESYYQILPNSLTGTWRISQIVSEDQLNTSELATSQIVTRSQLQTFSSELSSTSWLDAAVSASSNLLPGIRVIPPEMITFYHGTSATNAGSIRGQGIDVNHARGEHQDMSRGLYVTEDPVLGQRYASQRGGVNPEVITFEIPASRLGTVVDVRPGGAQRLAFMQYLDAPVSHYEPALGSHPMFSNMTIREYITSWGVEQRGLVFEHFLSQNGLTHADFIRASIGDGVFTGITTGTVSDQAVIRTQILADVFTASARGELERPPSRIQTPTLRSSAAYGAGFGGVIAIMLNGAVIIIDTQAHPNWQRELATATGLGIGGGALGGVTDTLATRGADRLISQSLIRGTTRFTTVRVMGGGAAGFIVAPLVEMGSMALDDRPHTRCEYAGRGSRAAVAGGISGAVSAGIVGAIWGSEVPILGNIVGFGIGVGVYWLADWAAGDAVQGSVQELCE